MIKYKIKIKELTQNRLFLVFSGIIGLFIILVLQFVKLQLVEQDIHSEAIEYSTRRTIETEGLRGEIYDRYGKPLAVNKPIYTLKIDQQVRMTKQELNDSILNIINLLEANGDTYIDELPISKTEPFVFTGSESARKLFINTIPFNGTEHRDELLTYTAEELVNYLRSKDVFQIDEDYTAEEARKIIAVRHQMFQIAYQKYKPITIAKDISEQTLSVIAERSGQYPNVITQIESYRYYPYGEAFGNILGYTRKITSGQYEKMAELGYDKNDVIGQMGIEESMEDVLRGRKGIEVIEVDNVGRQVSTLKDEDAVQGEDVFLTIDANIQLQVYDMIEKRLAEAIIARMNGGMRGVETIQPRELLVSMVESNQLDLDKMAKSDETTMQYQVYQKLLVWYEAYEKAEVKNEKLQNMGFKQFLMYVLKKDESLITNRELLLILSEQGSLKLEQDVVDRIWQGNVPSLKGLLIDALTTGKLKPSQMAIEPFSATAVVVEVNTGDVLALVSYPSYDSNLMTTDFNNYYSKLQDGIDQRNILWNRALMTAKAPGSTYKMISSIAGLETGVVTPSTVISDIGPFTKAGSPHPKCWFYTNNGYGHGGSDIHRALEVSCNYYFYETAYRMGLKYGIPFGAIDVFSHYAGMFGLNEKTGIELPETQPNISNPENLLTSNISKALNVIRNVTEKGQQTLDQLAFEVLEKGGYESSIKLFEKISHSMIEDMKKELGQQNIIELSKLMANDILQNKTKGSMMSKTKQTVKNYFKSTISEETYQLIVQAEDEENADILVDKLVKRLVDYLFENTNVEWTNAINVRTAIGQGNNAFTPTQIARYIAALANGETLYDLKIVNGTMDTEEDSTLEKRPDKVKGKIEVKDSTLNAVYEGMYRVTNGREGTARNAFADLEVKVAGKTGTAQETGTEHSWFAGFAPYNSPEIAVVTSMYDAKGLGKFNYVLASDIFSAILAPEKEKQSATLNSIFVN